MDSEKTVVGADNYYAYPSFEYSLPSYPIGCLAPSKVSVCSNNRGYGYFALPENEILLSFSIAFSPALAFNNYLHVLNDLILNEYLDIYSPSLLINRSALPPIQKVVVGADNYYYAFPTWAAEIPPLNINLLISCSDYFSFTSENLLSQIFEIGNVFSFTNEEDILSTLSLFDSYIQDANLFCDFLLSSTSDLHSFLFHIYGESISDVIKPTVRSENYYAFPAWLPPEHVYLQYVLTFKPTYESVLETTISNICRLDEDYSRLFDTNLSLDVFFCDSFINEFQLSSLASILVPLDVHPVLFHPHKKIGIIEITKPSICADNYYAYPSWAHEHLYLQFTLNCGESYELINEGLISKAFRLSDGYSRLYESPLFFNLLFGDSFSNEFQLLNIESLLTTLHLYPFLFHKYEKGIIDTIKPTVKSENYYAYPSWAGPEAISLLVSIPLSFTSHYQSIRRILDTLLLALKTHYVFPTNVLNIYLALGLNPRVGNHAGLMFYLPFTIHSNLQTIFDSYIKHSFNLDIFGSSIRDLNVPINLFLKHISSAFSTISFSQTLSSSSKVILEGMLETILPLSLKDSYSTEAITKGILTVTTEAAFVPLIQMVYEYSLTAPLIFSSILSTVKKAQALIKYLTIDIKKFNISINIETIERE